MNEPEKVLHSPLGKETVYANQYDPSLLYPIERDINWQARGVDRSSLPFFGEDIWNSYEISWLNAKGKPIVALAQFHIPATSTHIVESKSFKLYLNSYNLSRFESADEVAAQMAKDLSNAAGGQVRVTLTSPQDAVQIESFDGRCIDDLDITVAHYEPAPELLSSQGEKIAETLVSHLLKSNCPVTGQPDWASVQISYSGPKIDEEGLLGYLISYREHGDFHEQCVETIFMDILERCQPKELTVYARYVRRGGLDINPYRSTLDTLPKNPRLSRQ
ncbi:MULTISPECIES: NADPH-dependent 7-cyano-7-deazaguanine reductase QueF [unclassified Marinobacterium]|uniref:NADPH-dependent 7-cyano-7-deazaguanine reductase QueF n=1 Tax=unclassified Marinobacterium TaxID=2644139 RepID=UPI001568A565|nr:MULTISPECIES: NADPH-dependent 7-cyano-7-deazaguanine reductase QueF [unclassified Marinobacterium]NRP57552.1 NADPH-dependent 7-cyano-7-deazaguanine reductase [Marinobacterium sp. xm-d-510]NRP98064.1 NADPH-dependent 7-cyano-7-deazaguanine reductase [Marinobacterium sp. xm-a-127]